MITCERFGVTTPKWPRCCAEHAVLLSDVSGIGHTGPPLPAAWGGDCPKTESLLGQKGKPRDWGMRGLSGQQTEWRMSQAHLPPERCPRMGSGANPQPRIAAGPGKGKEMHSVRQEVTPVWTQQHSKGFARAWLHKSPLVSRVTTREAKDAVARSGHSVTS